MRRKKETFLSKLKNTVTTLLLTCVMLFFVQGYTNASNLRFVQVSDTHFLNNGANTTFKMIAESPKLLDDAIDQINTTPNVDFVMFTGDLIDKPYEIELQAVLPHVKKLNYPWYFAFGNHDICVGGYLTKSLYLSILRKNNSNFTFTTPYYSFVPKQGFKAIVLDSIIDDEITSNGYIYKEQLDWLDAELKKSQKDVVLIFMHVPLVEPFSSNDHLLRNSNEVRKVIEKYKNPIGVFSGHYHATKVMQVNNVLYVSSPALVSYPNAFRIIDVTVKKNKVTFNLKFKETGLVNIQKLAKLMVFASSLYSGEAKDQTGIYEIKR